MMTCADVDQTTSQDREEVGGASGVGGEEEEAEPKEKEKKLTRKELKKLKKQVVLEYKALTVCMCVMYVRVAHELLMKSC